MLKVLVLTRNESVSHSRAFAKRSTRLGVAPDFHKIVTDEERHHSMHENNRKKERYSENEAASKLGVSIEQLRALVKRHISREDDVPSAAVFQPSDLVLLRILSNMQQNPASGI